MAGHDHRRKAAGLTALALGLAWTSDARAIRPFITDDARVVGEGHVQIETYWRRDRESFQNWHLPAVGPTEWLELTLGGVHGLSRLGERPTAPTYAVSGPLAQGKFLLREAVPNEPPGVALSVGAIPPIGRGGFEPAGPSAFAFLAVTQAFFKEDDFLIHANIGTAATIAPGVAPLQLTWGIGSQVETLFDFHLIGEIFSGDPYEQGGGGAYQIGFRQIYNDHLQLDFTYGAGLWGEPIAPWFSSGVRIVSHKLW